MKLSTSSGTFSIRHGSEGPRHDPYGFCETTYQSDRLTVTLHQGLAQWLQVNHGPKQDFVGDQYDNDEVQSAAFKQLAGLTPQEVERYHEKLSSKCRKCGSSHFEQQSGFPGESFTICAQCAHVIDCAFDESAII